MRRLAIRPGGIGDCILGIPALRHLAEFDLEVWSRQEVLGLFGFASSTASVASTGLDSFGLPGIGAAPLLIHRLRGFDEIVTWYGAGREDFRDALCAVHPNVRFFDALPIGGEQHAADFFAAQVGAALPAVPRIDIEARPHRCVVIHPFSGSARKNWGLERFQLLARWLEASGRAVQFCVAPQQILAGSQVVGDLKKLGSWLAGGALYIGNDSGITHLAAACGANVLAIFGPTDERVWAPRGERVRILKAENLDRLAVEHVLDAALAQTGFLQD